MFRLPKKQQEEVMDIYKEISKIINKNDDYSIISLLAALRFITIESIVVFSKNSIVQEFKKAITQDEIDKFKKVFID